MRILLVDDEPLVLNTVGMFLTALGHEVSQASCGEELLRELECGRPCDVLITDLSMPGLSGLDLIGAAHRVRPRLPIIAMTGHFFGCSPWNDMPDGIFACLSKPFRLEELEALLAQLAEVGSRGVRQATAGTRTRAQGGGR